MFIFCFSLSISKKSITFALAKLQKIFGTPTEKIKIELLAPAKTVEIGKIAIDAGADGVYIGAPQFSARSAAGNQLEDIAELTRYAHLFSARVLVAVNTILTDEELEAANKLIWELYAIGVDGIIIQDMGLLETNLPPLRIHASTQCNNQTTEKVQWLEQIGFDRVVLARELRIDEIQAIRQNTHIELEVFVHGAICVSYSGQCYMSSACSGRSANRGVCSQLCRQSYDILDSQKQVIKSNLYALSLQDMDRSGFLKELLDAGVTSLKIEGRLKDADYVRNIVGYYREILDRLFAEPNSSYCAASQGVVTRGFTPAPQKTFHRGGCDYFIHGRTTDMAQTSSPKSTGEKIGEIVSIRPNMIGIRLEKGIELHNGDGLCFRDHGFFVNGIEEDKCLLYVRPNQMPEIEIGEFLFRNFDIRFQELLAKENTTRKLEVDICIAEDANGFILDIGGEKKHFAAKKIIAENSKRSQQTIMQQLCKLGNTPFRCRHYENQLKKAYFIPISVLNEWRRQTADALESRLQQRKPMDQPHTIRHPQFPNEPTDYRLNIHNKLAKHFYEQCGLDQFVPSYEQKTPADAFLMTCRYCLRYEMGMCPVHQRSHDATKLPAFLRHGDKVYSLHFDCKKCQMYIIASGTK